MMEPAKAGTGQESRVRLRARLRLRTRLIITAVAVLVFVGTGIGAASFLTVRATLLGNLDAQLGDLVRHASAPLTPGPGGGSGANGDPGPGLRYLFQPGAGDGAIVVVAGPNGAEGLTVRAGDPSPQALSAEVVAAFVDAAGGDAQKSAEVATAGGDAGLIAEVLTVTDPQSLAVPTLGTYRYQVVRTSIDGAELTMVIALPQAQVDSSLERIAWTIALIVAAGVLLTAAVLSWLIHRQLADLRAVARTAHEVAALDLGSGRPDLSLRVPAELSVPGTEVGDVGASMNTMLEHVDEALAERYRGSEQMRRFVADASHELRTPIATIKGWADLTRPQRSEVPGQVRLSLEKIDSGADRMAGLVDDLLLLARLEARRQPFEDGVVDLSALLIELVDDLHVVNPDHEIILDLPPRALEVSGTAPQVRQAISAVLGNACAHTPPGTRVTVGASVQGRGDSAEVAVLIRDDGPGIPPEILDRVFDRFVRGDSSRSRAEGAAGGSSGLGLAIAKGLVELMRGRISVESDAEGTAFTIVLPAI